MRYSDFEPSDYLDRLTILELERYHSFNHISRKREFVATRILRHELFGFEHIHYDANGAPFIDKEGFLSVSHSRGVVGIAINKHYQLGLDLEEPRANILELGKKFISDKEAELFDATDPGVVTKIWSAKEALYKLAGRRKIIFRTDLILTKDEQGNWLGEILNTDHRILVKLDIFEWNHLYITINREAIEVEQHIR